MERVYQAKRGKFAGLYHKRLYKDGKYTHVGYFFDPECTQRTTRQNPRINPPREEIEKQIQEDFKIQVDESLRPEKTDWDALIQAQKLKMKTIWK